METSELVIGPERNRTLGSCRDQLTDAQAACVRRDEIQANPEQIPELDAS